MTRDEFFAAVCTALGWTSTPWRIAVMNNWAAQEGMPFDRTFNPWATTQPGDLDLTFDQGYGPGNWNSVPVRVYRTPEAGIKATVETLQNGYYPNILRCFADQTGYQEAVKPHDFMSWVGSESYGQRLVDFMNSCTESKEVDEVTQQEYEDLLLAVYSGSEEADQDRATRLVRAKWRRDQAASAQASSVADLAASARAIVMGKLGA